MFFNVVSTLFLQHVSTWVLCLTLEVLTRRQQLEKEVQEAEAKEEENPEEPKQKPGRKSRARKTTKPAKEVDEGTKEAPEEIEEKPLPQTRLRKKTSVGPEEPKAPKAKAKAKAKAKGKAKAKAGAKQKNTAPEEISPATPYYEPHKDEDSEGEDVDMSNVKKRLFDSDDEDMPCKKVKDHTTKSDAEAAAHSARLMEEMEPKPIRDAKKAAGKGKGKAKVEDTGASEVKANKGRGRGGKGRGRGQKSPVIKMTPAIKKERARRQRKKAERNVDDGGIEECDLIKGIVLDKLKPVDCLSFEDLKTHLLIATGWNSPAPGAPTHGIVAQFQKASTMNYWTRQASGIKYLEDPKQPQIAYFVFRHARVTNYNHLMTAACVAAMLMVSFLHTCIQGCS